MKRLVHGIFCHCYASIKAIQRKLIGALKFLEYSSGKFYLTACNNRTDLKYLILLGGILVLAVTLSYEHYGHLLVDCGREVYYPTQILSGKVLYRDILNIYGPFSYMFNALLFKFFGINLNVLYIAGFICAFLITSLTYLVARRFLPAFLSFSISILTLVAGVLNLNLFNFIFPYSYGMLYGFTAFLISLWLILKYINEPEKNLYLYLSSFFAGLCIANKYEFLPYLAVILYATLKIQHLKFKQYCLVLFSLLFMPALCFGILFLQGLRVQDLISTAIIVKKMSQCQTLKYFYQNSGIFFHKKTIPFLFTKFIETVIPILLLFFSAKRKNISSFIIFFLTIGLIFLKLNMTSFSFLPLLILILFIYDFKNIRHNTQLMILALSTILVNLKVYWGLIMFSYGTFFIGLSLITVLALISNKFKGKINPSILGFYIILVSILFCLPVMHNLKEKHNLLKTPRGSIYTENLYYDASDELIKYIESNTKKSDTVVIFPEGLFINFFTDRRSDDYYNSLLPLYIETFGEEKIIDHFEKTKPEYIIFNNWNTRDYYFDYICKDYALDFCSFVARNYVQKKVIDKNFRYLIFKRKIHFYQKLKY